MLFELPQLRYAYSALEPVIDAMTVEVHHSKHQATYTKNLNTALEKYPEVASKSIVEILKDLNKVPEEIRMAVRNNGGGYYNHALYWENLTPNGAGTPSGKLAEAIDAAFGGFTSFKEQMEKAGLTRFGSGWAWLSKKPDSSLLIHSTANQDCPLSEGLVPLLTIDVWEHAYYLKYQNRRADYLSAIWAIIDWKDVENKYLAKG
jgi:Fe-Mn family superoxide dismutase